MALNAEPCRPCCVKSGPSREVFCGLHLPSSGCIARMPDAFFSGGRLPPPVPPGPVGGRGDDFRRTPFRHRDPRETSRPGRLGPMPTRNLTRVVGDLRNAAPRNSRNPVFWWGLPFGGVSAGPGQRRRERITQRLRGRVRVVNYSGSGIETTFTPRGRTAPLSALVPPLLPAATERPAVAWSGNPGRMASKPPASPCSSAWEWGPVRRLPRAQSKPNLPSVPGARHQGCCWPSVLSRHRSQPLSAARAAVLPSPIRWASKAAGAWNGPPPLRLRLG